MALPVSLGFIDKDITGAALPAGFAAALLDRGTKPILRVLIDFSGTGAMVEVPIDRFLSIKFEDSLTGDNGYAVANQVTLEIDNHDKAFSSTRYDDAYIPALFQYNGPVQADGRGNLRAGRKVFIDFSLAAYPGVWVRIFAGHTDQKGFRQRIGEANANAVTVKVNDYAKALLDRKTSGEEVLVGTNFVEKEIAFAGKWISNPDDKANSIVHQLATTYGKIPDANVKAQKIPIKVDYVGVDKDPWSEIAMIAEAVNGVATFVGEDLYFGDSPYGEGYVKTVDFDFYNDHYASIDIGDDFDGVRNKIKLDFSEYKKLGPQTIWMFPGSSVDSGYIEGGGVSIDPVDVHKELCDATYTYKCGYGIYLDTPVAQAGMTASDDPDQLKDSGAEVVLADNISYDTNAPAQVALFDTTPYPAAAVLRFHPNVFLLTYFKIIGEPTVKSKDNKATFRDQASIDTFGIREKSITNKYITAYPVIDPADSVEKPHYVVFGEKALADAKNPHSTASINIDYPNLLIRAGSIVRLYELRQGTEIGIECRITRCSFTYNGENNTWGATIELEEYRDAWDAVDPSKVVMASALPGSSVRLFTEAMPPTTGPYSVGDLWSRDDGLYVCIVARGYAEAGLEADWMRATLPTISEARYKRAPTAPATPAGDDPAGWTVVPPAGTDLLWMSSALKTSEGKLSLGASWSTPERVTGVDGADGAPGTPGAPGLGYAGLTSASSVAIGTGSKAFAVNQAVGANAFAVGNRVRVAYATTPTSYMEGLITAYSGFTLTVNVDKVAGSGTYATWKVSLAGDIGATGTSGLNTATVYLYKRSAASPAKPTVACTYTFSTRVLTGQDGGWTQAIPAADGNPLWVITATAMATAPTDTDSIPAAEWSAQAILAQDGVDGNPGTPGAPGGNTAIVYLYQRKATAPAVTDIADPVTYTFASKSITSGSLGAWSQTIPAGTNPLYVIAATAFGTGTTDTIARAEWSAPQILAQNGASGSPGVSSLLAYLSVPAVGIPTDPAGGSPNFAGAGTNIYLFEGNTALVYDGVGTTNGTWKATAAGNAGITAGAVTDGGSYGVLAAPSAMTIDKGAITITITGKRADGTPISMTVYQQLWKVKAGGGYAGLTSASSVAIGTGSKAFTVNQAQGANAYAVGQRVRVYNTATPANFMEGTITVYSGTTFTVNVDLVGGSGTFAAWSVSLTGIKGDQGVVGPQAPSANKLDVSKWVLGSSGSQTGFNQNGTAADNRIVAGTDPFGKNGILWECGGRTSDDPDGGWITTDFAVDHLKKYRFIVFFKRDNLDGSTYLGAKASTVRNLSDGLVNANPYFWTGSPRVLNRWYMMVGYIQPSSHPGTTSEGAVYDCVTGAKIAKCSDFKWVVNQAVGAHRAYYYYTTLDAARQWLWNPRVELCDGTEIPLESILPVLGRPPHYLGMTADNPPGANTYYDARMTGDWCFSSATKRLYCWDGAAWTTAGVTSRMRMEAFSDMLSTVASPEVVTIIQNLVANTILAAEIMGVDLKATETLRVGDRHAIDGSIADATKPGAHFDGTTGAFKIEGPDASITKDRARFYKGAGVQRRALQLGDESLDFLDAPDGGTERLRARIGRLGVGDAVLMDGEFNANIEMSWGAESVVNAASSFDPSYIQLADGELRIAYRRGGDNYLVERIWSGSAWGAESVVNAAASAFPSYIQLADGELRIAYWRASDNYLVERTLQRYSRVGAGIIESGADYDEFGHGLIVQRGTTAVLTAGAVYNITFPKPFTAVPAFVGNPQSSSGTAPTFSRLGYNVSATGFSVVGSGVPYSWIAVGK